MSTWHSSASVLISASHKMQQGRDTTIAYVFFCFFFLTVSRVICLWFYFYYLLASRQSVFSKYFITLAIIISALSCIFLSHIYLWPQCVIKCQSYSFLKGAHCLAQQCSNKCTEVMSRYKAN